MTYIQVTFDHQTFLGNPEEAPVWRKMHQYIHADFVNYLISVTLASYIVYIYGSMLILLGL